MVFKLVLRSLVAATSSPEEAIRLRGDELLEGEEVVLLFRRSVGDLRVGLLVLRASDDDTGGVFDLLPPPLLLLRTSFER